MHLVHADEAGGVFLPEDVAGAVALYSPMAATDQPLVPELTPTQGRRGATIHLVETNEAGVALLQDIVGADVTPAI